MIYCSLCKQPFQNLILEFISDWDEMHEIHNTNVVLNNNYCINDLYICKQCMNKIKTFKEYKNDTLCLIIFLPH